MRLIDTDEILTRIQKAYVDTELGTNKRAIAINIGLTKALNNVQDCKKIELKKGKWIRTGEDGYCSVCKKDMPLFREDWNWEYCETPFCPNCGADMRGDADE